MVQIWIQQVTRWDARVFGRVFGNVNRKSSRWFFYLLSRSADSFSCALAGLLWVVVKPSTIPYVIAGIAAFSIELSLYYLIKKNIRRPRPFKRLRGVRCLIAPPDEFSFPSGHTAAAFLMAVLASLAFPVLVIPAFLWAFLVGISRVYLGVHYPTDVLAGMVLGVVSAESGLFITQTLF